MTLSRFEDLRLAEPLIRALRAERHLRPTPIQMEAIPHILAARDLLATAQTGTGKTAAFLLPLMQRLSGERSHPGAPRALILAPTRELAAQIAERALAYARHIGVTSTAVFGGVKQTAQVTAIPRGTLVCRCEDVTRAEIEHAIDDGAREVNQVKAWTRCGMGPCQGRTCGDVVAEIVAYVLLAGLAVFQIALAAGAPLGHLAWGGKHRVLPKGLRIASALSVGLYVLFRRRGWL